MSAEHFNRGAGRDIFEHAVTTLELVSVAENICRRCRNEGARELVRALRPQTDRGWIEESLAEIAEAREFQERHGRLPMPDTSARRWFDREARDAIPAEGLLEIAALERSVAELRRNVEREEPAYARLRQGVSGLRPQEELVKAIDGALERDGEIKDKASPELKRLRSRLRRTREDIRAFAANLARSLGTPDDATFDGSRYMLVVPREKCQRREGIVHSTSHSGGSLYFEPFSLVEKNNALGTLQSDAGAEEARILAGLIDRVEAAREELLSNVTIVERLDALSAKAAFAAEFRCVNPVMPADGPLRLMAARHPLLELSVGAESPPREVVPLDLRLDRAERVLVITGPNAGGKTVALKTVGLLVLMHQSGLPVPCAEGTELALFDKIYADIGDEQSISSSLSTFTSHLRHLDVMCRTADENTLCLIDEIGDGTDPDEGAALAIASLERLQSTRAVVIASTHYGKVKSFALRSDGVGNASMVFDDENDRPLYRLLQGTAGRSRGIETARRLDFFGPVVERAQAMVGREAFRLEQLLSELESTRIAVDRERDALRNQSQRLNTLIESYDEKVHKMEEYEGEQRKKIRKEAEEVLLVARKEVEAIVKQIRETDAARHAVRAGHERIGRMAEELTSVPQPARHAQRLAVGDIVSLSPSGRPCGPVLSIQGDRAKVEINGKIISADSGNLYQVEPEPAAKPAWPVDIEVSVEPLATTQVDVRGRDREEALAAVDRFIDSAVMNAIREITIIHGVGERVLQKAIRSQLGNDSRIGSVRSGEASEGGPGVTIARLN
ncbi:MAG: Smr/MutS family protein [Candidatus Krumholzibacteria bacterium]